MTYDIYLIITRCYKIVLISSIKEGYIAMINSTDKISTRASCSIVVVFIVFSRCRPFIMYDTFYNGGTGKLRNEKKRKQNPTKSVKSENEIQRNETKSVK